MIPKKSKRNLFIFRHYAIIKVDREKNPEVMVNIRSIEDLEELENVLNMIWQPHDRFRIVIRYYGCSSMKHFRAVQEAAHRYPYGNSYYKLSKVLDLASKWQFESCI